MDAIITAGETRRLFLEKFLRHGRQVASFAPSGVALARAACRSVDRAVPQTIVELGAGTGAVTEIALGRMHPASRLLAIELDPDFAEILRRRCPAAIVVEGDAADVASHAAAHGLAPVDAVISGLALPSLRPDVVLRVLGSCCALARPGAWFSQLTILPLVYRAFYRRLFEEVVFEFVPRNLPPAGVYHCRGLRRRVS